MSLQPDDRPSELEWQDWETDSKMQGRKVTLEDLENLFPETNTREPVVLFGCEGRYNVWGRKVKGQKIFRLKLAYQCVGCGDVFIGPPEIREDPEVSRVNYDMYCHGCGTHLAVSPMREH